MSCRVLSSAKSLADLARLNVYPRNERVEYARLADAGVAGEGAGLTAQRIAQFIAAQGLPPISLHGLRHSFASVANSRSVPMFTISKALGHSSTSITSEVYTHLFDETVQDVVNVVAKAIGTRA